MTTVRPVIIAGRTTFGKELIKPGGNCFAQFDANIIGLQCSSLAVSSILALRTYNLERHQTAEDTVREGCDDQDCHDREFHIFFGRSSHRSGMTRTANVGKFDPR